MPNKTGKNNDKNNIQLDLPALSIPEDSVSITIVKKGFVISKEHNILLERLLVKVPITYSKLIAVIVEDKLFQLGLIKEQNLRYSHWMKELEAHALHLAYRKDRDKLDYVQYAKRQAEQVRARLTGNMPEPADSDSGCSAYSPGLDYDEDLDT